MKIKYYVIALMLFGWLSCTEENPIGDYPVFLKLNLRFDDKALRDIPSYRTYTLESYPINNSYSYRYGYGGVLVVHAHDGEYYAFDLSCPYENNRITLIEPDENVLYAICPKCGTKYDIGHGTGARLDGVGKSGLKPYSIISVIPNEEIIVSN